MADGDLLDFLSNNWGQLLGVTSPAPAQVGAPQGLPLPPSAPPGQSFSPSGAVDGGALNPGGAPPMNGPVPMPQPRPPGADASNVPLPMPRPPDAPPAMAPPLPPPTTIPTSTGPTAPLNAQPVTPPPTPAPGSGPPTATTGSLAAALGLRPKPNPIGNAVMTGLAGLGKGLSAVGSLPRGANAGQAFAAGAGGALTGGVNQIDLQEQQARQAKNDGFTQLSTAFRDKLAAQAEENTEKYRAAQSAYLMARAQSTAAMAGGKGTNAWQNTPLGQMATIEQRVAAYSDPRRKSIDAQVRSGQLAPDDAKQAYADLEKRGEQFRQNAYKAAGIDPKLRDAGENADNPISTNKMSVQQFHAQVPLGAWYDSGQKYGKDGTYTTTKQDGTTQTFKGKPGDPVIIQRTDPPPGWQPPQQQQQQQAPAAAPQPQSMNTDDMMAMQPAA